MDTGIRRRKMITFPSVFICRSTMPALDPSTDTTQQLLMKQVAFPSDLSPQIAEIPTSDSKYDNFSLNDEALEECLTFPLASEILQPIQNMEMT